MELLIGVALALLAGAFASLTGMDRDRSFYPTVLMVIATYYVAFALQDGRAVVLVSESAIAAGFIAVAVLAYRRWPWFIVAALVGHGAMDVVHHRLVANAGVPGAWPGFCLAFDLTAAAMVARLLARRHRAAAERALRGLA